MTFVSLAEAARHLGIDVKTLHRWQADAQLPLHSHPGDGRKKGVSSQHLQTLARLHQRSLLLEEEMPPTAAKDKEPELPAALLSLPEHLSTLQAQIAVLQQQVADLTRLLQQQAHPSEKSTAQASKMSKRPSTPPRPRAVVKTPRTPVHVIPRVEYGEQGQSVVISPKDGVLPFGPDTPEWFAWISEQDSFRFVGKSGFFTAHHEWRVKKGAWRAHRHIRNRSYTLRLAVAQKLTIAV